MDDEILSEIPARQRAQPPIDEELAALFAKRPAPPCHLVDIPEHGDDELPTPPPAPACAGSPDYHGGAMVAAEYEMIEFFPDHVLGRAMTLHVIRRNASRFVDVLLGGDGS